MDERVEKYFAILHPDYETLSPEEQRKISAEKRFIEENLDAIDSFYHGENIGGKSEQEKLIKAIRHAKVEKYHAILDSGFDYESANIGENWSNTIDKRFILQNLEIVDNYYQLYNGELNMEGKSEKDNLIEAIRHAKVDVYFDILHPDYELLNPEEQAGAFEDKRDIIKNLDAIDKYYKMYSNRDSQLYVEGKSEKEKLIDAMRQSKIDRYFDILHPDYDSLSYEEQVKVRQDKSYIIRNLDAIDNYYKMYSNSESQFYMDATEKEKIEKAISAIGKTISTTEIGKATINTPTDIKQQVAEVERGENDKQREGEEIDGN